MKESILAKILKWLVYAAAFVPLIIFSEYISPFHFGKVIIFRSLVYIMIPFYVLLIWSDKSYRPKLNRVGWSFLIFAGAFTISTIFSVLPYPSFWGSLERMGGLFTFWHYFIYFIILTSVFRTESDWLKLFRLMIAIGLLSSFYGFLQRTELEWVVGSGGRSRIFGTIGNAALFAGYQILCLFLAVTLFFRPGNSSNWKIFYGVATLVSTVAVLMTAVRGSILGIGLAFLAFALLYSSAYRSKKAKKYLMYLIALAIVIVMALLLFKNTSLVRNSGYLTRLSDFSLTTYTVQTRFWAWEAGIKGWKESPKTILVGWGPENFNVPFSKHFNPKFYAGPGAETLFDRAHNMFVEVLVTMGLIGFLAYIWIFASLIKVLWQRLKNKDTMLYGVGLISLVLAYAVHNSFIFDTSANFLTFFTVVGFVSFLARPVDKTPATKPVRINNGLWSFAGIILFIVSLVAIYQINVMPSRANYTTTRAIVISWNSDFAGSVAKYKEALEYDVPGKYEIRNRFAQYVLERTNSEKLSPAFQEAIFDALEGVQKNIDENKVDYLPYLYASRLYITLGKEDKDSEYNDKALEMSRAALELSPTFVRAYYEVGQAYLNKEDYAGAAEAFKKATELNPEVGLSHWYYGIVEIQKGNVDFGLDIVQKAIKSGIYAPTVNDLGRLVSVFLARNDYEGLAWAYELMISIEPTNAQHHASLAVAYANLGLIDKAIAQAKEAARLDKNYEGEARSFIQSLGGQW